MDRYRLYERCVQSPAHLCEFLLAVHGGAPKRLREDFSGTGALARYWCAGGGQAASQREGAERWAVVVDLDEQALEACRGVEGVEVRCGDVLSMVDQDATDVIFVGNFSIGYIHKRRVLMQYLVASRRRLARWGTFICDMYGGPGAMRLGGLPRRFACENGDTIHYYWSHESADPVSGMVENTVSFRIERAGEIIEELPNAFAYRWRLWSLPELREAMLEAGFSAVDVYNDVTVGDGGVRPIRTATELGEDWTALICAR
ncbi:MAG: hypothetical protein NTV94_10460 [Planctomycetota bacterium]|nr:hypothetical protein [Planctomycetota bacterium]